MQSSFPQKEFCIFFVFVFAFNYLFLFSEHGHGGHGHSHGGISHGGIGRSHTRLTQLVSTDDNENDETFNPPLGPTLAAAIGNNKGHSDHPVEPSASQMNMRGVFLHVMADALGSVIVIVSASVSKFSRLEVLCLSWVSFSLHFVNLNQVVWLTEWEYRYYMDPALSVVMVILILRAVWPLLQESALILLQTVPTHIQVDAIQRRLLDKVDGVLAVHEFHVWQLAGDRIIASAHIR